MRLVVHQPNFMPWIGMWAKIAAANVYVIYAGVKFDRGDHMHRVTIAQDSWVGAQVGKSERNKLIKDVRISEFQSLRSLSKTLRQSFMTKKFPYGERLGDLVSLFETWSSSSLLDLDVAVLTCMNEILQLPVEMIVDVEDRSHLEKIEKLRVVVEKYGSDADYYMGSGGLDYMSFDDLPGHKVYAHKIAKECSMHSIVEMLVSEKYPREVIDGASVWEGKDGKRHRLVHGERLEC